MKVEIDQSGKIENTSKDTVLAFSNDKNRSVKIPAKIKRQLQEAFRRRGKVRIFIYRVFTAGVYLLIKPYLNKLQSGPLHSPKIVDTKNYPGRELGGRCL